MPETMLAYFSEDYSETNVEDLRRLVQTLAAAGAWSRALPRFADEVDDSSCTRPGDEPIRTVGVLLEVSEPGELPETPVEEVTRLFEAVAAFSAKHLVDFEVQYRDELVGSIFNGVMDRGIREGLLESW
jgi:hypothetical protein